MMMAVDFGGTCRYRMSQACVVHDVRHTVRFKEDIGRARGYVKSNWATEEGRGICIE
jgi:hypothetical protein